MLTSVIQGGVAPNVVPDRCVLTVGRRMVPGEDPEQEYHRLCDLVRAASPLPVEIEPLIPPPPGDPIGSPAFYTPPDCDLARVFTAATGEAPACAPFGTNALRYKGLAREMVVFGPGSIDDAHRATECVEIEDLVRCARAYEAWLDPRPA
jgi:acetylornithine deacetylase/succinyl-diaminopimelate desuccinylase-like protein